MQSNAEGKGAEKSKFANITEAPPIAMGACKWKRDMPTARAASRTLGAMTSTPLTSQ